MLSATAAPADPRRSGVGCAQLGRCEPTRVAVRFVMGAGVVESTASLAPQKIVKIRGSVLNDDAAMTLLYLAIKKAGLRWSRRIERTADMGQSASNSASEFRKSCDSRKHHCRMIIAWSALSRRIFSCPRRAVKTPNPPFTG